MGYVIAMVFSTWYLHICVLRQASMSLFKCFGVLLSNWSYSSHDSFIVMRGELLKLVPKSKPFLLRKTFKNLFP